MLTKCKLSMQREVARGMNMVTTTNMSFKMMLYHGAKHDFKTSISYEQFPVLELYEAVKWSGKEHAVRDRWEISAGRAFKPRSRRQRANKFLYHMDQPTCSLLYVLFFSARAALPFTSYLLLLSYLAIIHSAVVERGQPHKWNRVIEATWEKAGVSGISI